MNDTAGALAVIERQLAPLAPRLEAVLDGRVTVPRLIQTVLFSVERLPRLIECDRQSLFNAAMSAAVLGLEVDGVTGQAFLIPFKNRVQLVIGYKGYNTMAARSGITITGGVVREGDEFDFALGSAAFVRHVPRLNDPDRRHVAAWASATSSARPTVVAVLGIDELLAVKSRSPGAQKHDSPWNDPAIGFPAMCEKTAKRRLARSMPLNVMQRAARLDEAFEEQGRHAYIRDDGNLIVEGEVLAPREASATPTTLDLIGEEVPPDDATSSSPAAPVEPHHPKPPAGAASSSRAAPPLPSVTAYIERWSGLVDAASSKAQGAQLAAAWNDEKELRKQLWPHELDERYTALHRKVSGAIALLRAEGR